MDGPGEELFLFGYRDRVEEVRRPLGTGFLSKSSETWNVGSSNGLNWKGDWPRLELVCEEPRLRAETESLNVLLWGSFPKILTYWSAFGGLTWMQNGKTLKGVSVTEHAFGGDSRLDLARLAPPRWHWDVLTFDDGSACAGLSATVLGRELPIRSGGSAPGMPFSAGRGLQTKVLDWERDAGRNVPRRWTGRLALGERSFHYEAIRSTPVAPVVPGGGFLGFDFEGRFEDGGPGHTGTGFTEYRAAGRP